MKVLDAQSCPGLCYLMDCSSPGSSVHGILQARILEWAAISFSRGSPWPRGGIWVSHTAGRLFTAEPPGKHVLCVKHCAEYPRWNSNVLFLFFNFILYWSTVAPLVAQMVKNPPAMQETWVWSLGWEEPPEEGMTTHSCILAWRIPWTEGPGGLQSMGSQRVRHNWATQHSTSSISSVVTVSSGQQRDSATHMHIFILSKPPCHLGCHRTLSRVPCTIQ